MSSSANIPSLQAVTPNGIHNYLTQAAAAIQEAAASASLETLTATADRVQGIYDSVQATLAAKPKKPNGTLSSRTLEAIATDATQKKLKIASGESFNFAALRGQIEETHSAALELIAALRLSTPSPAPSEEEQAEPEAPAPFEFVEQTNTPPPATLEAPAAFSQFGTFVLPEFTGPFVFTAGQTDDAAPAALPSADREEDDAIHAGFAPTGLEVVVEEHAESAEQTENLVPHLDLTALRQGDQPARADGAGTPHSQAPSESDDGEETSTPVSARSQQHSPAKQLPDDINVGDESDDSGDELVDEDRKEAGSLVGQPTDILVEEDDQVETTTRCRPGRKTACAAVTTALAGVGYFFRDRLVQAGQTAVTTVTPHATALWTGVKAAVVQRSSQLAGLAVTAWEKAPSRTELLNAVVEPISEELASDELVHPSLPITRSPAAQATLVIAAVTLIKAGHYLTSRSKPKAD